MFEIRAVLLAAAFGLLAGCFGGKLNMEPVFIGTGRSTNLFGCPDYDRFRLREGRTFDFFYSRIDRIAQIGDSSVFVLHSGASADHLSAIVLTFHEATLIDAVLIRNPRSWMDRVNDPAIGEVSIDEKIKFYKEIYANKFQSAPHFILEGNGSLFVNESGILSSLEIDLCSAETLPLFVEYFHARIEIIGRRLNPMRASVAERQAAEGCLSDSDYKPTRFTICASFDRERVP